MRENSSGPSLADVLAELGVTSDEVARQLRAKGVRGVRNAARNLNPIVRYAQSHVTIDALGLDLTMGHTMCLILHDNHKVEVPLPAAVKKFLDAFNAGKYPDLELPTN